VSKETEEILLNENKPLDAKTIACHVREIIKLVGEDPGREGLRKTPERYERALKFLTSGYNQNLDHILNGATFSVCYDEMVVVKDIEFFSLCEHHLLPFFGKAHIAYLPDKKVLGLSKVARLVNMYARRLQIQERMTSQIAKAIEEKLAAPLHADARCGKAAWTRRHERDARRVPPQQADARRISRARPPEIELSLRAPFWR